MDQSLNVLKQHIAFLEREKERERERERDGGRDNIWNIFRHSDRSNVFKF